MGVLRGEEEKGGKRHSNTAGHPSHHLDIHILEEATFPPFVSACWVSHLLQLSHLLVCKYRTPQLQWLTAQSKWAPY